MATELSGTGHGFEYLVLRSAEGGRAPGNQIISGEEYDQARMKVSNRLRAGRAENLARVRRAKTRPASNEPNALA